MATCTNTNKKSMPSLFESFSKTDKKPFGLFIAYQQLQNMFTKNYIYNKKQAFNKTWNNISDTSSVYICIAQKLFVNEEEIKAMKDYVYAGNSLFIAANYIDENLLTQFECSENYFPPAISFFIDTMQNASTKFFEINYSYYYYPFKNSFDIKNPNSTKTLGVNYQNQPNFIVAFYGKGKIFLHCDAKAFSNYFLLKNDNYQYFQNALTYMPANPQSLYWDDYYHYLRSKNNSKNFSSFNEINKYPPLATAFWLCVVSLLLYVLFNGKRRQRIIEKIKPNQNNSMAFTETIGRLYLQKNDNKNIAEKMCTYFNEHIRNNYFLYTNNFNDAFFTTLSKKTGVSKAKVESLYRAMQHAQKNDIVDDYQLLSLNEQMQFFYKKI